MHKPPTPGGPHTGSLHQSESPNPASATLQLRRPDSGNGRRRLYRTEPDRSPHTGSGNSRLGLDRTGPPHCPDTGGGHRSRSFDRTLT